MSVIIEDLQVGDLKIYQDQDGFKFGTDAILLAWFCRRKRFATAVDLCSGNGIIPLLLSLAPHKEIVGVEILKNQVELFEKSVRLNGLSTLFAVNQDIKEITPKNPPLPRLPHGTFDLVSINPPYFEEDRGLTPKDSKKSARSEVSCTLEDTVMAAKTLLKHGGRLCMVHKPERLADIFEAFRNNSIEPKELMPIISRPDKKPELILIEGRKGGGKELIMHHPLYITDENGNYTPELCRIYGFDRNLKG